MHSTISAKPVTLKQIAELAQCSLAAVSTTLNKAHSNSGVSAEKRARIEEIAAELGYRPNFASRSLKMARSHTIGVYVQPKEWRGLSHDYEMSIFRGIEQAAREFGYDILVLNISSQSLPEICAERLREKRIDGVLLLHTDPGAAWIDQLLDYSANVVAIDYNLPHPRLSRIEFDNHATVRIALEYLRKLGHRRIGFAGSCVADPQSDALLREQSFRQLIAELNLENGTVFNHAVCPVPISLEERFCQKEGIEAIRYFHALPDAPTAVIAYNSLVGIYLLREAARLGIRVPDELSVVSIDRYEATEFSTPQLTCLDHRLSEEGYAGTEMLVRLIEHHETAPATYRFTPFLVEGGSTAMLK